MSLQVPYAVIAHKIFWDPLPTPEERSDRQARVMKVFKSFAETLKDYGFEDVQCTYSETRMRIYYEFLPIRKGKIHTLWDALRIIEEEVLR